MVPAAFGKHAVYQVDILVVGNGHRICQVENVEVFDGTGNDTLVG